MKKLRSLIPRYSILPLALLLVFHSFTFYGTRLFTGGLTHYNITTPIDDAIPFVPAFIIIYVLAFAQWAFGIWYFISRSKDVCFKFIAATLIGEVICLTTFIVFPTVMTQPEDLGGGAFSWMTSIIYTLDEPNNLFPSLHCFASWMCFRGISYIEKEKRNKFYTIFSFVFSLLVFASTVFVKQHVVADIAGGVLLVEIGILAEKITGAHKLFYFIDSKLSRKDKISDDKEP
ncbi:MAG: phosphatase PAP2 family protein [Clostridia bacterium]|nr:phosphatase PAP2 family protein [Clostridia bacterium]